MAEAQCGFCPSLETKAGEVMQSLMSEHLQERELTRNRMKNAYETKILRMGHIEM